MIPPDEDSPEAGPILVTGATGTLGGPVVSRLVSLGTEVRALSRRPQAVSASGVSWWTGDLRSGEGIDRALTGVRSVLHCASSQRGDPGAARNLLDAMSRTGAESLVYISIVGVDRLPLGYYKSKLETERLIEGSDRRWTILRTTQFHNLLVRACHTLSRSPVMPVLSGTSFQPIDVDEVADRLVELAVGEPGAGRVADMGGPDVRTCAGLARSFLSARGRHRLVMPVRFPGAAFKGFRSGYHLAPEQAVGKKTFDEFLAEQFRGTQFHETPPS